MSIFALNGTEISSAYNYQGTALSQAYDVNGVQVYGGEESFAPTTLAYDTNWFINSAWLANAQTQRDAVKAIYQQSEDAIPFFIQTDGHGRYNEGNKGCHNLTESVMRYIPNLQLGDYASYYNYGANPTSHGNTSAGIANYLCAMGNHEFMSIETGDIPDLPTLVASYVPTDAIIGSSTYGYYKKLDNIYNVKWLVTQPHIPNSENSSGFVTKITSDQYAWLIYELEANDGYDIVFLQHEPVNGTYTKRDETTYNVNATAYNVAPILSARKAKTSGSFTDSYGVTHTYDFSSCTTDVLCALHGHQHVVSWMTKQTLGFPVFVGRDMTNAGDCCYGLIDRTNGKLYIYCFTKTDVSEPIILDL